MSWDGAQAKAQTSEQPTAQLSGIAAVAAEFLLELQQFRESLEGQGRDFSEDELKAVKEQWADIVERAEKQPEQMVSDAIMLTDLAPYLVPLHDHPHHTYMLPHSDDEQFSLSLE